MWDMSIVMLECILDMSEEEAVAVEVAMLSIDVAVGISMPLIDISMLDMSMIDSFVSNKLIVLLFVNDF